jgi:NAD(P) transhydrogenase subunit alpha
MSHVVLRSIVVFCLAITCIGGLGNAAESQPAAEPAVESNSALPSASDAVAAAGDAQATRDRARGTLIASITIFVLAIFVGFEVITKVPPTLHTPLMSGSNAISGITLVGALLAAGARQVELASFVGALAVILATINAVGGFLVTHRMLAMFRKK